MDNKIVIWLVIRGMTLVLGRTQLIAEGSKNFIALQVLFSPEWDGLTKYAVCYRNNREYPYLINDKGLCVITDEAVAGTNGEFKLKVIGAKGDITAVTNIVTVHINDSKFTGAAGGTLEYPTNDYLAQTLSTITQKASQVDAAIAGFNVNLATKQDKLTEAQLANLNANHANYLKAADIAGKQDKLTAGQNITITGNVISATGGGAGDVTKAYVDTELAKKQDALVAGNNISIAADGKTISANVDVTKAYVDQKITQVSADIANNAQRITWLEKLGKGILYDYSTDSTTSYTKSIPSGAKAMDIKSISGKSWVLNQILKTEGIKLYTKDGLTISADSDHNITISGTSTYTTGDSNFYVSGYVFRGFPLKNAHKYWVKTYNTKWTIYIYGAGTSTSTSTSSIFTATADKDLGGISIRPTNTTYIAEGTVVNETLKAMLIDLTQAGLDSYSASELDQMFPNYIPYTEPTLTTVNTQQVVVKGRNLVNPASLENGDMSASSGNVINSNNNYKHTEFIKIKPSTNYYVSNVGVICFYDSNYNRVAGYNYASVAYDVRDFTSTSSSYYVRLTLKDITKPAYFGTTNVVVPYHAPTAITIPTAIAQGKSAGSVADECQYYSVKQTDGTYKYYAKVITRIGQVDLGSLSWTYASGTYSRLTATIPTIKNVSATSVVGNIICPNYTPSSVNNIYSHSADKTIGVHNTQKDIWIYDSTYTDASAFKSAMNGVILYYELATPTETVYELTENLVEALSVEGGGSVTIYDSNSSYKIGVPSTLEYLIALNEV